MTFSKRHIVILLVLVLFSCKREENKISLTQASEKVKVLILTETKGYRHESIEAGLDMFKMQAENWQIEITHAAESAVMTGQDIHKYDIMVLLNTTGDVFTEDEQVQLQDYLSGGGAILGIHAAADAEYDWPWYGQMLGGLFHSHPHIQHATCTVADPQHPLAKDLPVIWKRTDEWYNFKQLSDQNDVILLLDETSYSGGIHTNYHPISWSRQWGGGRIFYTGMGHTVDTYNEELFQTHIRNAIQWLKLKD